jgi:hypothetical protein
VGEQRLERHGPVGRLHPGHQLGKGTRERGLQRGSPASGKAGGDRGGHRLAAGADHERVVRLHGCRRGHDAHAGHALRHDGAAAQHQGGHARQAVPEAERVEFASQGEWVGVGEPSAKAGQEGRGAAGEGRPAAQVQARKGHEGTLRCWPRRCAVRNGCADAHRWRPRAGRQAPRRGGRTRCRAGRVAELHASCLDGRARLKTGMAAMISAILPARSPVFAANGGHDRRLFPHHNPH